MVVKSKESLLVGYLSIYYYLATTYYIYDAYLSSCACMHALSHFCCTAAFSSRSLLAKLYILVRVREEGWKVLHTAVPSSDQKYYYFVPGPPTHKK